MDNNGKFGLSSANRNYLTALFFVGIVVFEPFFDPKTIIVRFTYFILTPVFIWFAIRSIEGRIDLDAHDNDRINRALTGVVAGALIAAAHSLLTAESHLECTQYIQTRDGRECVGEYLTVDGPDRGGAFVLFLLAGVAFSIAIARQRD